MAIYTVTTLEDEFDYVDENDPGGTGLSLREALELANANTSRQSIDLIVFADELEGTIRLKAEQGGENSNADFGALVYKTNVRINGDNRIVITGDTANNDITTMHGDIVVTDLSQMAADRDLLADNVRIFQGLDFGNGAEQAVVFTGLTLTSGVSTQRGGAINTTNLDVVIHDSTLIGNQSGLEGGAVHSQSGALWVLDSTFIGNRAAEFGGAISHFVQHEYGAFLVHNSTIVGNHAGARGGGGIYFGLQSSPSVWPEVDRQIAILNSTILGNSTEGSGGGIFANNVDATIGNSIILGNEAANDHDEVNRGEAVFLGRNLVGESTEDFNAEHIGNVDNALLTDVFDALQTYDLTGLTGGELADNGGPVWTVALKRSADNPAIDAADHIELDEAALNVDLNSNNDNRNAETREVLDENGDPVLDENGDPVTEQVAVRPNLTPDDIFTETSIQFDADGDGHSRDPNSRVRDSLTGEDGRGAFRPVDSRIVDNPDGRTADLGAYELQNEEIIITVTTLFDESYGGFETVDAPDNTGLSLREAIGLAKGGPATIVFDPRFAGQTLELTDGDIDLTDLNQVVINGDIDGDGAPDITLDAKGRSRVFNITDSEVTLNGLVITGGQAAHPGETAGGGLRAVGLSDVTITNSHITKNYASGPGGGISLDNGANVLVVNSTISDNAALRGGGVDNRASVFSAQNTTFFRNFTEQEGSAIRGNSGTSNRIEMYLDSVTISGNVGRGAMAVTASGQTWNITNSIITGNVNPITPEVPDLFPINPGVPPLFKFGGNNLVGQTQLIEDIEPIEGTQGQAITAQPEDIFETVEEQTFDPVGPGDPQTITAPVLDEDAGRIPVLKIKATVEGGIAQNEGIPEVLPEDVADIDGDGDTTEPLPMDALGRDRQDGGAPDIGAVEYIPDGTIELVVTTLDDETFEGGLDDITDGNGLSLREAIALANADPDNDYTITFDPSLVTNPDTEEAITTLEHGELAISSNVTINGDTDGDGRYNIIVSASPDAGKASRIFNIDGGGEEIEVELQSLRFILGNSDEGGAVRVGAEANLIARAVHFAVNNRADEGGALFVDQSGSAEIYSSYFASNNAFESGGAIFADNAEFLKIVNSTFWSNNVIGTPNDPANVNGASALHTVDTEVVIRSSTFYKNGFTATNPGDFVAIVIDAGSIDMKNTIVSGNGTGANGTPFGPVTNVRFESGTIVDEDANLIGRDPVRIYSLDARNNGPTRQDPDEDVPTLSLVSVGIAVDNGDGTYVDTDYDGRGEGFLRFSGKVDIGAYELQQATKPFLLDELQSGEATVEIVENTPNGTVIFDINAVTGFGETVDENISYRILGGNGDPNDPQPPFAIDPDTGVITLNDEMDLDFQTTPSFTLGLVITNDLTGESLLVPLSVNVVEVPSGQTIIGDDTDELLQGTTQDDSIDPGGGDDIIIADAGNDQIGPLDGKNWLDAGQGDDTIFLGLGDSSYGSFLTGNNDLVDSDGFILVYNLLGKQRFDDVIDGGLGTDTLIASEDDDVLDYTSTSDGPATVPNATPGDPSQVQRLKNIEIFDLLGGDDDLNLTVGAGLEKYLTDVTAFGREGRDRLWTGAGNDTLFGGEGSDFLSGGGGDDILYGNDSTGGDGALDYFAFGDVQDGGTDRIKDFEIDHDVIFLVGFNVTSLSANRLSMTYDDVLGETTIVVTDDHTSTIIVEGIDLTSVNATELEADNFLFWT